MNSRAHNRARKAAGTPAQGAPPALRRGPIPALAANDNRASLRYRLALAGRWTLLLAILAALVWYWGGG